MAGLKFSTIVYYPPDSTVTIYTEVSPRIYVRGDLGTNIGPVFFDPRSWAFFFFFIFILECLKTCVCPHYGKRGYKERCQMVHHAQTRRKPQQPSPQSRQQ